MKQIQNKKLASLIAVILMVSIATPMIALPVAAQTVNVTNYHTWLYVGTSAGGGGVAPIGQGQTILLVAWTKEIVPDIGETAGLVPSPNGRAGWDGMQINVTKPDNTTEIVNMPHSDPVGANYVQYVPDQLGTYTVRAIFPATWKNSTNTAGTITTARFFSAAVSDPETFTVQADPVPMWNESPLPEDYWTRPINGAARTWFVLAGNKLGGAANVWPLGSSGGNVGNYGWGQAPESAHVLWTKPFSIGGIMDERLRDINYHTSHYQGTTWSASLIVDGKIYYSPRYTTHGNQGIQITDLYTGETLLLDYNGRVPNMASVYLYESPNQHGGFTYLWQTSGVTLPEVVQVPNAHQAAKLGSPIRDSAVQTINTSQTSLSTGTLWEMKDGWTMNTIAYIANVSSQGTQVYGKDGSILYYNMVNKGNTTNPRYYLTVWNSSAGTMVSSQDGTGYWQWRPAGGTFGGSSPYLGGLAYNVVHDGQDFYSANFTIPSAIGPINARRNETGTIRAIRQDEYMIVGTEGWNDDNGTAPGWMMGISLAPNASQGTKLWEMTYTPPAASFDLNISAPGTYTGGLDFNNVYPEDGVLTWSDPQQLKRWVYDLYTGELLWESEPEPQFTYYGISQIVYQGQLIGYGSYAGQLTSYNIKTGEILWKYNSQNVGFESPYGNYPMIVGAVADGKIYTYTSEHSFTHPQYRGPNLRCIDATTGKEVFSTLFFGGGLSVADGILLGSNSLDNEIYAFGRGPSATTVSAPQTIPALGASVMITGTVTDQTPTGRRNTNDKVDFTLKGTPAIADSNMSAWMEYKFQDQAYPANLKGVDVSLQAIDPNGNVVPVGTVTSDERGNYAVPFTPEVPGTYQIIATFAGSASYGASFGTAYLAVGEEVAPTAAPTETPLSAADMYFVPAVAGLAIAIIVVGIVLALLLLRKRA